MKRDRLTGLILAGGAARRFGSDKAGYTFRGRTLLEHVYAAVEPLVGEVLISVQSREDAPSGPAARIVRDRKPGLGPMAGLHAGLEAAGTPWLLVAPCDMPFLTRDALATLVRRCRPEISAVVAVDRDGQIQPLCACYHRSILPIVERRLESENRSLHGLLDDLDIEEVHLPDRTLLNVNHVSDLDPFP